MRDPNRIPDFCDRFEKLWKENCPDWRFGQLIANVIEEYGVSPFLIEDNRMIEIFEDYFTPERKMFKELHFEKGGRANGNYKARRVPRKKSNDV